MHLAPNSFVVSLLKMLTYCMYAALLRRLTPRFVEHPNLLRSDVKSRIHAGGVIYYF